MNRVLIIGQHVMKSDVMSQYIYLGFECVCADAFEDVNVIDSFNEFFVFPVDGLDDAAMLDRLEKLIKTLKQSNTQPLKQSKPRCHILLHDSTVLWILKTIDTGSSLNDTVELIPFTVEDNWAQKFAASLPVANHDLPPLDRIPIDANSDKTVHLLIFGADNMGLALAHHAALAAHFPNYQRDNKLRTRITIVDSDMKNKMGAFVARYRHLFENSYYRFIDAHSGKGQTMFHEPQYEGKRKDFVDVEWEFVEGDLNDKMLAGKLDLWIKDGNKILTIALCHADGKRNTNIALTLPESVFDNKVTVLVSVPNDDTISMLRKSPRFANIYAIGMENKGYDVRAAVMQVAKMVNYCYLCVSSNRGIPDEIEIDATEREWRKIGSFRDRYSNMYNVLSMAGKMRSIGHEVSDWKQFFAVSQDEVDLLSAVEHNRWSVERLMAGFRPPDDLERKEISENIDKLANGATDLPDKKKEYKNKYIHYDLCAYDELGIDKSGQNVRFYDFALTACIPLIANKYFEITAQ